MATAKRTPLAKLARGNNSAIICLGAIKQLVRQRWSAVGPAANSAIEALLRQKLGPADHFIQIDELHWLVVMPETPPDELHACCLRIAYNLHNKVQPPCDLSKIMIAKADVVADDMLELSFLDREHLRETARRAGLVQELLVPKPLTQAASADSTLPCAGGGARFQPVWDSHRQVISLYLCQSDVGGSGSHLPVGELLKCAQTTLGTAVHALESAMAQGTRSAIFVPLPYDMLSAPTTRMEFLSACRQLACALRPYLLFEISHLPPGIPKSRLIEIVSAIQPFVRAVTARVAPNSPSLMDYGGTGLKALGLDVPVTQAKQAMYEVTRLATAAKRLGVVSYIGNVVTPTVLDHAIRAGIQWVSGPIIGAPLEAPAPPVRLTLVPDDYANAASM